ncbi:MAG TPA: hypothetical protein ENK57_22760 [Polyangiaceae bacterium]|nr:hypothetical protein [Polyangiaceae bacterium]
MLPIAATLVAVVWVGCDPPLPTVEEAKLAALERKANVARAAERYTGAEDGAWSGAIYGKWSQVRVDHIEPGGKVDGKPCANVKFTHTDTDGNVRPVPPMPTDPEQLKLCKSFGTCQLPNNETHRACREEDGLWHMRDAYQKKK